MKKTKKTIFLLVAAVAVAVAVWLWWRNSKHTARGVVRKLDFTGMRLPSGLNEEQTRERLRTVADNLLEAQRDAVAKTAKEFNLTCAQEAVYMATITAGFIMEDYLKLYAQIKAM